MLGLACIAAFLFLIDYSARLLRPVSLVRIVGQRGLAVIESVYPEKLAGTKESASVKQEAGPAERTLLLRGTSGIILAVDITGWWPRREGRMA